MSRHRLVLAVVLTAIGSGAVYAVNPFLVTAPQGGVARWTGLAAKECGIYGKRYPAVDAACYYPADIKTTPGVYEIALWDQDGKRFLGALTVEKAEFSEVEMTLPESLDRFLHPSADEVKRSAEERAAIEKVLGGEMRPPQFSLPLGKPVDALPKSEDDFGSLRHFDAEHTSRHTGRDYPIGSGTSVKAVADGNVVLAADHFYTGNAVFIDHGAGLISMNFHLDKLAVATGDEVKRGQSLGTVGATGRATGPHLHLGLRWLRKRIDPALLLDDPAKLPTVSDAPRVEQAKIDAAEAKDPPETDDTEPED